MELLWPELIGAGALGVVVVVLGIVGGLALLDRFGPPVPAEIPPADRPLFRAAFKACRREMQVAAWGSFPPGLQRFDARVYASAYVMIRDLYLADTEGLSRPERELVATAVSVSNLCYYCTHNHAALLRASDLAGVEALVLQRTVDHIPDERLRHIARFALEAKANRKPGPEALSLTDLERSDAASIMFTFNYVNRVVDVVGPTSGIQREIFAKPPAPLIATMLGLRRKWRTGQGLRALGSAAEHVAPAVDGHDEWHIRRWTLGDESRARSVRFIWSAIQRVAHELFDAEVLFAIRQHLDGWQGGEFPLTGDWHREENPQLSTEDNQTLAEFGILIARCAYRVSADKLLEACGGDRRRRLVLVAYASCAAALRINEWLPFSAQIVSHQGAASDLAPMGPSQGHVGLAEREAQA